VSTVKQVAGEDPGSLLAQERPPGQACAPRGRVEAVAAQRFADRGGRDLYAEVEQLTLDPLVAPAGVLGGQTDDQLLDLRVERGTPASTMRVGPGAGDQPAAPAQQCLGLDQEARPAGPGQQAADRGEQGAVGGFELGAWDLAAQHGELVAQDQELQVFGGAAADQQGEQLDGAAQHEVGELGEHEVASGINDEEAGASHYRVGPWCQPQLTQGVSAFPHPTTPASVETASKVPTPAIRSTIGLAHSPGTAVLPTWWTSPTSHGPSRSSRRCRSRAARTAQPSSDSSTTTGSVAHPGQPSGSRRGGMRPVSHGLGSQQRRFHPEMWATGQIPDPSSHLRSQPRRCLALATF